MRFLEKVEKLQEENEGYIVNCQVKFNKNSQIKLSNYSQLKYL